MKKTLQHDILVAGARVTGNADARTVITRQPRRPTTIAVPLRRPLTCRWITCPQTGRLECRWARGLATFADSGDRRRVLTSRPAARRRAALRRAA